MEKRPSPRPSPIGWERVSGLSAVVPPWRDEGGRTGEGPAWILARNDGGRKWEIGALTPPLSRPTGEGVRLVRRSSAVAGRRRKDE